MISADPDSVPALECFFGLTRAELAESLDRDFRATQIFEAIYAQWVDDFDRITNLPKPLRANLQNRFDIRMPEIHRSFSSDDGTQRYLLRLPDGEMAETVFIPDGRRNTICVSSQVGCALACSFCLTGQLGFTRHLTAGEVVAQVVLVQRLNVGSENPDHFNVVLMGMGEPLHNYGNVMKALEILHDPAGLGMSMSRITLSTAGLIPELERLASERLIPNLAVSLTGVTNESRDRLMPINRTYPIEVLASTLGRFPLKPRQRITFEYVLIRGITDSVQDARRLARAVEGIRAKVNLIPLNESPDLDLERSPDPDIRRFKQILEEAGVPTFVRRSRGSDISAACGQLKKKWADGPPEIDLGALEIGSL